MLFLVVITEFSLESLVNAKRRPAVCPAVCRSRLFFYLYSGTRPAYVSVLLSDGRYNGFIVHCVQVSLKSRTSSCRRRGNDNDNDIYVPAEDPHDVMSDGSSSLAGKYAMYRPRPGKNAADCAVMLVGREEEGGACREKQMKAGAVCRPFSEPTFVCENSDKARTAYSHVRHYQAASHASHRQH